MSSYSDRGNIHSSHRTSPYIEKGSLLGKYDLAATAQTRREIGIDIASIKNSIVQAKRNGKPLERLENQLKEAEYRLRELEK